MKRAEEREKQYEAEKERREAAEMKPLLPVIDRKGRIEIRAKDAAGCRSGAIQQSTAFARWEDIDEAITPEAFFV